MSGNGTPQTPATGAQTMMAAQMEAFGGTLSTMLANMKTAGEINMMVAQGCADLAKQNAEDARAAQGELSSMLMEAMRLADPAASVEAQRRYSDAVARRSLQLANRNLEWAQALLTKIRETAFAGADTAAKGS